MSKEKNIIKGRGAQLNVRNKFLEASHETRDDFLEYCRLEGEVADNELFRSISKNNCK